MIRYVNCMDRYDMVCRSDEWTDWYGLIWCNVMSYYIVCYVWMVWYMCMPSICILYTCTINMCIWMYIWCRYISYLYIYTYRYTLYIYIIYMIYIYTQYYTIDYTPLGIQSGCTHLPAALTSESPASQLFRLSSSFTWTGFSLKKGPI
jgi:hypothetical protein